MRTTAGRLVALLVVAVATLLLGMPGLARAQAASDDSVALGLHPSHTGFRAGGSLDRPPLTRRWTKDLPSASYPLIAEGKLFVSYSGANSTGPKLAAFSLGTGEQIWLRSLESYSHVTYADGRVLGFSRTGVAFAVSADTGATLWSRPLPEPFDLLPPVAAHGNLYIDSRWSGGRTYALDPQDGSTRWTEASWYEGLPTADTRTVYLSDGCHSRAHVPATGAVRWSSNLGCTSYDGTSLTDGGRLMVHGDFPAEGGRILDSSNGALKDTYFGDMAVAGSTDVVANGRSLVARNGRTGTSRWEATLEASAATAPVVVNHTVYVPLVNGKLVAHDLASGAETWRDVVAPGTSSDLTWDGMAAGHGVLAVPLGGKLAVYQSAASRPGLDLFIASGPETPTNERSATFRFDAPGGALFLCRLDGGGWEPCSGEKSYADLPDGPHSFEVKTVDATGADVALNARGWSVDTTGPKTKIAGPGPFTRSSARFDLAADDAVSWECRLDGAPWEACEASKQYTALADGPHLFEARGKDHLGNIEEPPASYRWTVDTQAPSARIDSGPEGTARSREAAFTFSSDDSSATFECALDSSSVWEPCSSPKVYTGLADGTHWFYVRARDRAGPGPSASRYWSIDTTPPRDTTPPETTITSGPAQGGTTTDDTPTFEFSSSETGSTFECRVDSGTFALCSSPHTPAALSNGSHTFEVRAIDPSNNVDSSPAGRTFMVAKPPPPPTCDGQDATLVAQPGSTTNGTPGDDVIVGTDGDDVIIGGGGHDRICGRGGRDQLSGEAGVDRLFGEAENDVLHGGDADDVLEGGDGKDYLIGVDGNDRLHGGEGDDPLVYGGRGDDTLEGGTGHDVVYDAGDGHDALAGGDGNDYLIGGAQDDGVADGNDTFEGDAGDDYLIGGDGNDRLDGGEGDDPLIYGGRGDDFQEGGTGNDVLYDGGDGDNILTAGAGNDILIGGAGRDGEADGNVVLEGREGNDYLIGGDGWDSLFGGEGDDPILYGGRGNDYFEGGSGNDASYGVQGDDTLRGGEGDDGLDGGEDSDDCDGGPGTNSEVNCER